jgi:hypothetical protein
MGHDEDGAGPDPEHDTADQEEYHELIVDGTLDLHMFSREIRSDWSLTIWRSAGKRDPLRRIIHGKGTVPCAGPCTPSSSDFPGSYRTGSPPTGGRWGATVVSLEPCGDTSPGKK